MTVAGTVAFGDEDVIAIEVAAAVKPVSVTLPTDAWPPATLFGATKTDSITGGLTVTDAAFDTAPLVDVTVHVAVAVTGTVVDVNVTECDPTGTTTEAGTGTTAELLLANFTVRFTAVTPESVTVPMDANPPVPAAGVIASERSAAGFTVRFAVFVTPLVVAVIVEVVSELTGTDVITNVVDMLPSGIVTEAGSDVIAELSLSVTITPPVGANPLSLTVAVEF